MRKLILEILFATFLLCSHKAEAQKNDTIRIDGTNINTKVLKEGIQRYLVYFKMNKDAPRTETQFWTRTIKRSDYNGKQVIEITQEWEDKDSVIHTVKSISDAATMQPLYHKTWWKVKTARTATTKTVTETIVDFVTKTVHLNGNLLSDSVTTRQAKAIWDAYKSSVNKNYLNWHLDLETFPLLPYKNGVTFLIPFYDPGTASKYQTVAYTVTGSVQLVGYDSQKIDCWLLEHNSKGNKEVFWISKKTKEVLKLEQELNKTMYRYKIKLGFSM
ncbi:MAG: hypothetical protein JSU09_02280 [Bacteroidetes bacterium]|nr:hypothetical protein [Bacteroidota bacterium]